MSAGSERRCLRPRYVFFCCSYVWVVDETQPVAALFDPHTDRFVRLVSWTDLPAAPPGARPPEIVAGPSEMWVQNHPDGPVVRVGVDGIVGAEYTEGHRLLCAGPGGAWCVTVARRRPDIAPTPDVPPRRSVRPPVLLVALPGGGTRRVVVDAAAIVSVEFDESSLFVGVEHDPWVRVPAASTGRGGRGGFEVHYRTSVLQIPLTGPIPERIGPGTHPCTGDRQVGYTSEYADVSYNETHRRKRAVDTDLRWHWGTDPTRPSVTIVRAYRSDVAAPVTAFDLPGVRVSHGAAGTGRLWLITISHTRAGPGRAMLTAGVDGVVPPLPVEGIDITERCRPVGPEPLDHGSYVAYVLRGLDGVRFSDTVDEVTAACVGRSPHVQIEIRFRHRDYPDVMLAAQRRLYDEQGIRLDGFLTYVPVELMEQADTRAYPPVSDAVDGVLYV